MIGINPVLRPYQLEAKTAVYHEWSIGNKNVLMVLPTGGGKTKILATIASEHQGASCVIAHRQELVIQISIALAREGIKHRIIGPKTVVKLAVRQHMKELSRSFYEPSARCAVAGVDTLIRRTDELAGWLNSVTLCINDEAHHPIRLGTKGTPNKWGLAIEAFKNAKNLGVTATPLRADGKGLGSHSDGYFDTMVVGPNMRELINQGFLTDYRIFAPKSDLDVSDVSISKATGDYNKDQMIKAVQKSHIVGDVVDHYKRIAMGKLGITFAVDVATATEIAAQFNAAGVPAEVVSAKTADADRTSIMERFKRKEILQVVNVDLFGEGFDAPSVEVCSFARPTASYGLFIQQFGRALRILEGKKHAIIIDHVNNVVRHGLPDRVRTWSLDRRDKRSSSKVEDGIPVKSCPSCTAVYERVYAACPFCGFKATPAPRSTIEQVDGDLLELDAETLAAMRGDVEKVDMPVKEYVDDLNIRRVPHIGQMALAKKHKARQEAQLILRESISWLGGYYRSKGMPDSESYRRFYFKFGVSVLEAQTLKPKEAEELTVRINLLIEEMTT